MPLTTNKIVSDIRNIASSGSNPVEFRIEDTQILFWCNEIRSMLIAQAIQRRNDISDTWLQSLTCLELEQVDKSECCEITTNCVILRTVRELPDTLETIGDNFIVVNKDGINYYIIEHIDEWFVVDMVDDTYGASELYLCDQYDGLIKFLNDKEVITYRDGTI